jgi:hypothetical protein
MLRTYGVKTEPYPAVLVQVGASGGLLRTFLQIFGFHKTEDILLTSFITVSL